MNLHNEYDCIKFQYEYERNPKIRGNLDKTSVIDI